MEFRKEKTQYIRYPFRHVPLCFSLLDWASARLVSRPPDLMIPFMRDT